MEVRFLLFYSELAPLTRDVTCSRLYFDGKKYEDAMSDKHPPSMQFKNFYPWQQASSVFIAAEFLLMERNIFFSIGITLLGMLII